MFSATCCHLNAGTLWGMRGSFWLAALYFWHTAHLLTTSSMSTATRVQYMLTLSLALHLSLPRCPSWITRSMSGRRDAGTTRLSPNNSRPSAPWSSWRISQYAWISRKAADLRCGHPCRIYCFNFCITWSFENARLNCSSLSIVACRFLTRPYTSTSMSSGAP